MSRDLVESICSDYALQVRLVIVNTRWLLCVGCVNFPCLKVKIHYVWSMMWTKILKRHALVDFKPSTERAGVILLFLNLVWI